MIQDKTQEVLYTVLSNFLTQIDKAFQTEIQEAGNINSIIINHLNELSDFEKKQLNDSLDNIERQFKVFREWVMMLDKYLVLLGLPALTLNWAADLDEDK